MVKKITLIGLSLFGVIFLPGCGQKPASQLPPVSTITTSTTTVTTPPTPTESQLYKNNKYGFELTLPNIWQGYNVANRTLDFGNAGKSDSIDFGLPAQKDGLFNISVHTKKQWENIQKEEGPKPEYLAENNLYVFSWSQAQYAANSEMEKRLKEVKDIIKTFKFIK
ncbi:MAG: hypothetical protein NT034_03210 [Candidatus Magasanikbacteria bacterium]|nr:hypothetical protein [Candidatus Magasanikbacteria bacterium]